MRPGSLAGSLKRRLEGSGLEARPAICSMGSAWFVYIVRCVDGTLYTGVARDIHARLSRHNAGTGARYTRGRRPVELVYSERVASRSEALRREHAIKRLSAADKQALVVGAPACQHGSEIEASDRR